MPGRVTQLVSEVLAGLGSAAHVRASQIAAETLVRVSGSGRASQVTAETLLAAGASHVRAGQIVLEVLMKLPPRASQIVLEALVQTPVPPAMPAVFPALAGLEYPVRRRALYRTLSAVSPDSGRSVRADVSIWPVWEWDLSYSLLPGSTDYTTLLAFFLAMSGNFQNFLYKDNTFNTVVGQTQMYGDGATFAFALSYIAGLGSSSVFEPVGWLDLSQPFNLYVGGVLKTRNVDYWIDPAVHNQVVRLVSIPAPGVPVRVDMSFFYCVRFKDDTADFEQFMSQMWTLKKITLQSVLA